MFYREVALMKESGRIGQLELPDYNKDPTTSVPDNWGAPETRLPL